MCPFDGIRRSRLPNCPVCNESVELKNAKTDGNGKAVHEECFLRSLIAQPEKTTHPWDQLARLASQEQDSAKLIEITEKLNQAMLDEEEERVRRRQGKTTD